MSDMAFKRVAGDGQQVHGPHDLLLARNDCDLDPHLPKQQKS